MSDAAKREIGSVASLWRYPVKSMQGEELNAAELTPRGVLGDRMFALRDASDGKVVSAKNPKKWPQLFRFRAAFVEPPAVGDVPPRIRFTLPDGTLVCNDDPHCERALSEALGRAVTLEASVPEPVLEEYWPDIESLDHRDIVTDERIPEGSFFDGAAIHLLTTSTIDRLRRAYPAGRFEVRRFRPNLVVAHVSAGGFVENDWVGHRLLIGSQVCLRIDRPCPRCVMTTLPQGDLPHDLDILRTAAQQNRADVGVYATVEHGGTVRWGDAVSLVTD